MNERTVRIERNDGGEEVKRTESQKSDTNMIAVVLSIVVGILIIGLVSILVGNHYSSKAKEAEQKVERLLEKANQTPARVTTVVREKAEKAESTDDFMSRYLMLKMIEQEQQQKKEDPPAPAEEEDEIVKAVRAKVVKTLQSN